MSINFADIRKEPRPLKLDLIKSLNLSHSEKLLEYGKKQIYIWIDFLKTSKKKKSR